MSDARADLGDSHNSDAAAVSRFDGFGMEATSVAIAFVNFALSITTSVSSLSLLPSFDKVFAFESLPRVASVFFTITDAFKCFNCLTISSRM